MSTERMKRSLPPPKSNLPRSARPKSIPAPRPRTTTIAPTATPRPWDLPAPAPTPPDATHWLGTDDQARDVLARTIYGFRISVLFGFTLTIVSAVIGVSAGAIQGFYGGWIDLFAQRFIRCLLQQFRNPVSVRHIAIAVIRTGIHRQRRHIAVAQARHQPLGSTAQPVIRNFQTGFDMHDTPQPEIRMHCRRQRIQRNVAI